MSNSSSKGTALITGASRGIGAVYAHRLAKRGFDLILVARSVEPLNALVASLSSASGRHITSIVADLNNETDLAGRLFRENGFDGIGVDDLMKVLSRKLLRTGTRYLRMKAMDTRLRARRAPFGLPAEERSDRGKSRLPSKVNPIIETAIKKIYLTAEQPDVAAVIEEVQLKCFNAKTETSSAADPATDFRHSQ